MTELVRMTVNDYDELIGLMDAVFGRKNGYDMHFEEELPKMCHRDDLRMNRHFGIREDGRLVAALGVYPLPTVIAGEKLLFSTMGNVATHWDFTGKGYMTRLIARAQQELDEIGADASRLGGKRERYHRYGFEQCGTGYSIRLEAHNKLPADGSGISFEKIDRADSTSILLAKKWNDANPMYVERPDCEAAWESMTAWRNIPYMAYRGGRPIGYVCANAAQNALAEINAESDEARLSMLAAWQKRVNVAISFPLMPQDKGILGPITNVCEHYSVSSPSMFYIRNFAGVTNALMKLQAGLCDMPEGEWVLGIENYGSVCLFVKGGVAGAEKTNAAPDLTLPAAAASRLLYGPLPPYIICAVPAFVRAWLPLPLSWNSQDRV